MTRFIKNVTTFHKKHGDPVGSARELPGWRERRKKLIMEEARELCEALDSGDLVRIACEVVDVIYVAIGVVVGYGIPLGRCWTAVHEANMRKSTDRDPNGKPIKPDYWVGPEEKVRGALRLYGVLPYHDEHETRNQDH